MRYIVLISIIWITLMSGCLDGETGTQTVDSSAGKSGSMARFAVVDDALYLLTANHSRSSFSADSLMIMNVSDPLHPVGVSQIELAQSVETIYATDSNLYFGTTTGMLIFDRVYPFHPKYISRYDHVTSCDPVIVSGIYAYVTLRAGRSCGGWQNQLEVVDLTDIKRPKLVASYPMAGPYGLGIDDSLLFVCDGNSGLKVFNVSNPVSLKLLHSFSGFNTYDVIPQNGNLFVTGSSSIDIFSYSDTLIRISTVPISK